MNYEVIANVIKLNTFLSVWYICLIKNKTKEKTEK